MIHYAVLAPPAEGPGLVLRHLYLDLNEALSCAGAYLAQTRTFVKVAQVSPPLSPTRMSVFWAVFDPQNSILFTYESREAAAATASARPGRIMMAEAIDPLVPVNRGVPQFGDTAAAGPRTELSRVTW
jgi:hypothetical protein